jgi:iron-sulfur cluster protein
MNLKEILSSERTRIAKKNIAIVFENYLRNREKVFKELNVEELKAKLKRIKEESISNLEKLKGKTVEKLKGRGIKVFEAKDSEEAKKILLEIIKEGEVVVKAKSNTINEIDFDFGERNKVIETDCGDFIVQICDEKPTHPVLPALHIPTEKIAEKINEKFRVKLKSPEEVAEWIREYLKNEILKADVGLTGANAISSDGGIFILENEGNISLVTRLPKKHVIIAGIDKIVFSAQDALVICQAQAIWGVGNVLPTYINIISSPSKTADIEAKDILGMHGAKEIYLILLDNGRSEAIKNGFKELLYCINCGSCLYFCPVYRQIFDKYGLKYFGGRGVGISAFIDGIEKAFTDGLYLCTTCSACKENCPLEIDIPELMRKLRKKAIEAGLETEANKRMVENVAADGNPFGKIEEGKIPKELYCC